ncbi:H/ACA ribonucleoprotein complex subunit 3 [Taenia crassiceps]|uniref:Nucleolar protein 10 n=1 Tax=Taenia crassiceps TaxID=6207 RepID=A0ABR4Q6S3_9CEST
MHLRFYLDAGGRRVYTMKVGLFCRHPTVVSLAIDFVDPDGKPTQSAHPARYSPDDKYSEQRVVLKSRFHILPTQQPPVTY